jgi:hypothetical protein
VTWSDEVRIEKVVERTGQALQRDCVSRYGVSMLIAANAGIFPWVGSKTYVFVVPNTKDS